MALPFSDVGCRSPAASLSLCVWACGALSHWRGSARHGVSQFYFAFPAKFKSLFPPRSPRFVRDCRRSRTRLCWPLTRAHAPRPVRAGSTHLAAMVWLHEADVVVQTMCCRSGKVVRTQNVKRTCVGYCMDDANRALLVVGNTEKDQLEWAVAGGVQIIAKFAAQGKATFNIARQHKMIFISRADPQDLIAWLKALKGGTPSSKALSRNPRGGASGSPSRPLSKRTPSSANVPSSPSITSPAARQPRKSQNLSRSPGDAPSPALSPGSLQRLSEDQQEVSNPTRTHTQDTYKRAHT